MKTNAIADKYRDLLRVLRGSCGKDELKKIRKALDLVVSLNSASTQPASSTILHLLEVARICVGEIGLGAQAAIAAILHETLENKQVTRVEIEKHFDSKVAEIVEGYTLISGLDPKDPKTQAELFRQMLITLSGNAVVILIKLADRLETMRSLSRAEPEVRQKRSWETFHLYAPLAHRLGLYPIKSEMEDLAMKHIYPKEYKFIVKKLRETTSSRNRFIRSFIEPIEQELKNRHFDFEIKGRPKSVYSIFRKMQKQDVDFEDVYDVFAIRIILNTDPEHEKSDCWQVYSIITDKYTPNPERLRDWISAPKSNGYESLHTTVLGPEGKWIEVQIRTSRMDEIAEKGFAAHWKYKGIKQEQGVDEWVSMVRNILESPDGSFGDKTDLLQLNLNSKDIFVFTPKGEIRKLPSKATVLDFAFDIHSEVGSKCTGAIVNGKNAPIKQVLQNGDIVEVLTSKKQKPKKDWLNFVTTSKAKTRIKQQLREVENQEIARGREMLLRRLKNWKVDNPEEAIRNINKQLKLKDPTEIFVLIAEGKVNLTSIKDILTSNIEPEAPKNVDATTAPARPTDTTGSSSEFLIIDERLVNIDYKLAKCCNPIFGDEIFGFVTVKDGIKIHRQSCPNATQLNTRWGYRIVKARWRGSSNDGAFQTSIMVTGMDELGMLNRISEIISKDLRVNMRNLNVNSKNGQFEATIQLYVQDKKHLEMLLYRLGAIPGVSKAERLR
ncbi:MAG: bifunctional (p)ppGpp synthetase/guanosine-3',5'-bis(diphosphate) 3'-pyrophosphohydrolase [Bacteroidales bacterium]|nr:bifunctional (p)ppGpp synthetase/guanosine-3',5'-bis(diphosphate) 3'-pyrophosphohydrolase [Bacteroidales bacterium]HRC93810.1 RelA/SpoT family protein [Tenuifilaceae bacterium]